MCRIRDSADLLAIHAYADYMHSPALSDSDDGDNSTDVSDLLQGNSSHSFAEDQVQPQPQFCVLSRRVLFSCSFSLLYAGVIATA